MNPQLQRSCAGRVIGVPRCTTSLRLIAVAGTQPKVAPLRGTTSGYDAESRWDSEFHLNSYSVFIKTVAIRAGFFCRKRTQRSQKALGWIFIL
jgi:hypothetical protein